MTTTWAGEHRRTRLWWQTTVEVCLQAMIGPSVSCSLYALEGTWTARLNANNFSPIFFFRRKRRSLLLWALLDQCQAVCQTAAPFLSSHLHKGQCAAEMASYPPIWWWAFCRLSSPSNRHRLHHGGVSDPRQKRCAIHRYTLFGLRLFPTLFVAIVTIVEQGSREVPNRGESEVYSSLSWVTGSIGCLAGKGSRNGHKGQRKAQ